MLKFIDFYQTNCGPCKMVSPSVDRLAEEFAGRVEVTKINLDDKSDIDYIKEYSLMSTPTFVVEKDGFIIDKLSGFQPYEVLENLILTHLEEGK